MTEAKHSQLLPCPFCGSSRIKDLEHLDWVCCQDCGASLEDVEPSARALWNTRASPEAAPTRQETIDLTLTAGFTKSLPGGALDDSTYSQIEDALDAIDAPMTDNGRYMTLVERILALKSAPAK